MEVAPINASVFVEARKKSSLFQIVLLKRVYFRRVKVSLLSKK